MTPAQQLAMLETRFTERLDDMLVENYDMWGSPEAFELQVLLLLELSSGLTWEKLIKRYHAYLEPRYKGIGCRYLSGITDEHQRIARELSTFRGELSRAGLQSDPDSQYGMPVHAVFEQVHFEGMAMGERLRGLFVTPALADEGKAAVRELDAVQGHEPELSVRELRLGKPLP